VSSKPTPRKITGWHALGALTAFFGVVVAVNVYMAREAFASFGGLVVDNSYVASQDFNRWLDEAKRSKELGWQAQVTMRADRHLAIALTGAPAGAVLTGEAWHPLGQLPDVPLVFSARQDGIYLSDKALPHGRWTLRLEASAGGDVWRSEQALR
jgi:nitrogen fixation protein FixH